MLESLSKALQPISLLAIVTLSIFNLGYFWKIGLHFLGLMDFSNIVYSFGLTLTVLTAVLIVGNWVAPKLFKPITPDSQARIPRNGYIVWVIGFFFLWFGYLARDEWFERLQWGASPPAVMREGALLVGWCLLVIALAALQWLLYKAGVWEVKPLLMLAFFACLTTFQAGKLGAELEIHSSQTYSVASKSGGPPKTITKARILRTSSAGFILVVDGRIIFIPHSEIMEVKAEQKVIGTSEDLPELRVPGH